MFHRQEIGNHQSLSKTARAGSIMGATAPQKVANMMVSLERRVIAPTEIIARAI